MKSHWINISLMRFQFHKGTIRTGALWVYHSVISDFNSIKVQLEHEQYQSITIQNCNFNSIKVQLEHWWVPDEMYAGRNFNSIKVQLELLVSQILFHTSSDFNSIKVLLERRMLQAPIIITRFQFHKGTIRTVHPLSGQHAAANFNSIKVQLELEFAWHAF